MSAAGRHDQNCMNSRDACMKARCIGVVAPSVRTMVIMNDERKSLRKHVDFCTSTSTCTDCSRGKILYNSVYLESNFALSREIQIFVRHKFPIQSHINAFGLASRSTSAIHTGYDSGTTFEQPRVIGYYSTTSITKPARPEPGVAAALI